MLVRSGITRSECWFPVSDTEQETRFQARLRDPTERWERSPMDLEARNHWVDSSRAEDAMSAATTIPEARRGWWPPRSGSARLNVIHHLLGQVPHEDLTPRRCRPGRRSRTTTSVRPGSQNVISDVTRDARRIDSAARPRTSFNRLCSS